MIHVCYCLYDSDGKYSKFCATSMVSIFENTSKDVTIHLIHDDSLTKDNRDKFNYLAGRYGQRIIFYHLNELVGQKVLDINKKLPHIAASHYSIGSMYRLLIPDILPADIRKVMVHCDINDYWKIDISNYSLAATTEVQNLVIPSKQGNALILNGICSDEDYFNSGTLIMNLDFIRNHPDIIPNGVDFIAQKNYLGFDMEIFNYCFKDSYLKLPRDFGCYANKERTRKPEDRLTRGIFHFPGIKPSFDLSDSYNRLYVNYFEKTPWFKMEDIARAVDKFYRNRQSFMLHIMRILVDKQRAFYTEEANFNFIRQIFKIKADELILNASAPQPDNISNLLNSMNVSRGKKFYFILTLDYVNVRNILIQNNFVDGQDFTNAMIFLPELNDVPVSSYTIFRDI